MNNQGIRITVTGHFVWTVEGMVEDFHFDGRVFFVNAEAAGSIGGLKNVIQDQEGIPVRDQVISGPHGYVLDDQHGIAGMDHFYLTSRLDLEDVEEQQTREDNSRAFDDWMEFFGDFDIFE